MKITPAQKKILGIIARTGFCHEVGTKTTNPARSLEVLGAMGLIAYVVGRTSPHDPLYLVTPAGEAVLAKAG